jgi:hypothetical protein
MEIRVPHQIVYEVTEPVPVSDLVASLLATERLLQDTGPLLQEFFPGLGVQKIAVSVGEISEGSLKEMLFVALFIAFQRDLERDVPAAIGGLTGAPVPGGYESIVTIIFCLLIFYGVDFVYAQVNKGARSKHIRKQLEDVSEELARETGLAQERITQVLEAKFGKSGLRVLASAAVKFFTVSKHANNAPVSISKRTVDKETVAEVPSEAQIEEANVPEIVQQFENVEIELHAQDVDRAKTGWAAVVPQVSPKRLRMELYPPIKPEDIYTKSRIQGDVAVVLQKKSDGSYKPTTIHLMKIRG